MKANFVSRVLAVAAAGAAVLAAPMAHATSTGIDVTSVVTSIGDQAAPIALIGGAVLVLTVGIKAFKWVRRALS